MHSKIYIPSTIKTHHLLWPLHSDVAAVKRYSYRLLNVKSSQKPAHFLAYSNICADHFLLTVYSTWNVYDLVALSISSTVQCSVQGSAHYNNQAMALGELLPYIHQQMDNCISGYTLCTNAASIANKIGTKIRSYILYQKGICLEHRWTADALRYVSTAIDKKFKVTFLF